MTAPLFQRVRSPGKSTDLIDEMFRGCNRARFDFVEDFLGSTLASPTILRDDSPLGAPTAAAVANSNSGHWLFRADATDEAQVLGFTWGDILQIDAGSAFYAEFRLVGLASATSRLVIGVGTAFNAVFDNITKNVWFRIEGAEGSIYCEVDDGTNDLDDRDTGLDLPAGLTTFAIDGRDKSAIRFYVNDNLMKVLAAPLMSGGVQPIVLAQRDSGTSLIGFQIDYYRVSCDRL